MKLFKLTPLSLAFYHIVVVSIFTISLVIILQNITLRSDKDKEISILNDEALRFQKVSTEKELIDLILKLATSQDLDLPKKIYSYTNNKGEVFGNAKVIEIASRTKILLLKEIANKQTKLQTKFLGQNKGLPLTVVNEKNNAKNETFLIQTVSLFDGELILGTDTQKLKALGSRFTNIALLAILPTIIFALISGKILTNRSSRKIYEINETLYSLSKGNLSARVRSTDDFSDDILSIAKNINMMATNHQNAIETLNQVSTDIAHDLKSPIQRVQLSIAKIQKLESVPSEVNLKLNSIQDEINNISSIFTSILEIAQIEVSSYDPPFERVDLKQLTYKFFELYEPLVKQSDHQLIADFEVNNDFFIIGNEELIGRLIVNLIENSIHHTPKGVKIKIQLKHYDKYIRLIISDNGSGIPTSYHKKVLKRFYRMEASRTTQGSGLGLSLVSAIAKLHNAKLTLKNNNPGLIIMLDFVPAEFIEK